MTSAGTPPGPAAGSPQAFAQRRPRVRRLLIAGVSRSDSLPHSHFPGRGEPRHANGPVPFNSREPFCSSVLRLDLSIQSVAVHFCLENLTALDDQSRRGGHRQSLTFGIVHVAGGDSEALAPGGVLIGFSGEGPPPFTVLSSSLQQPSPGSVSTLSLAILSIRRCGTG